MSSAYELIIDRSIGKMIKREFPEAFSWKTSDKFQVGIPDRVGCMGSVFFAIEIKRPGGKVTPLQAHTLKLIEEAGGETCVAYSVQEAREFMAKLKSQGGSNGRTA